MIEPEDFQFYEKIQVPPPTWCPECRMIRRMRFYPNIFARLYKRKCDATHRDLISIYSPHASFLVYERSYWFSDNWNGLVYGTYYDFSRPFFEQFQELQKRVPRYHAYSVQSIDCEYCLAITRSKNCYLSTGVDNENCLYSTAVKCKECIDCWFVVECELCYFCINSEKCYRVYFGQYVNNCLESAFLYNCSGCSHCFGCSNLKNKSYYIFNRPYSKGEYFKIVNNYDLGSLQKFIQVKNMFANLSSKLPHRFAQILQSVNVDGDRISYTKNCSHCFDTYGVEDCKYVVLAGLGLADSYDVFDAGTKSNLLYEVAGSGVNLSLSAFINWVTEEGLRNYYADLCVNCSNLFGCVGLRNKQYCILNRQYSKEEYEALVPKIIAHMNDMPYVDSKGRIYKFGEFFPPELSPFAYNETIAQEYFPLTKEQAISQGYSWKDPEERNYQIQIPNDKLPDNIRDVGDDIINKVIGCAHAKFTSSQDVGLEATCNEQCTTAFKIIPDELQFYRKMNLPLPRLCPNCRHYQRLKQRNPLKLWHRSCQCTGKISLQPPTMSNKPETRNQKPEARYANTIAHFHGNEPCPNEFETSYAPERQEIVYCENCYNAEIV